MTDKNLLNLQMIFEDLGKKDKRKLSDEEHQLAIDYLAIALFEMVVEEARNDKNALALYNTQYGFLQVKNKYTIISIRHEVMVISWDIAWDNGINLLDIFYDDIFELAKDSRNLWYAPIIFIAGAFLSGVEDGEDSDFIFLANDSMHDSSTLKVSLKNIFKKIRDNYDDFIFWIDFDKVYGNEKNTMFGKKPSLTDFWEYITEWRWYK